jgi:MFS family permease
MPRAGSYADPGWVQISRDRNQRIVLLAYLANALGTGLFLPVSVIYLTRIVGLPVTRVGLGLTIAGLIAVVAGPCAGPLLDRFDARAVVVGCFAASALGFAAYLAVGSFPAFLAVAIVIQFAARMGRPAGKVLALRVASGRDRVIALAWQRTLTNLGYGVGGLLAGLALLLPGRMPFDVLLASNAVSYVAASVLILRLPALRPPPAAPSAAPAAGRRDRGAYRQLARDRVYLGLAGLDVLVSFHDSVLLVAMPLWVSLHTTAPLSLPGFLFALNTLLVVLLQVRFTRRFISPSGITRGYRTAAIGFVVATACFAISAGATQVLAIVLLVLAVSALTLGEIEATAGEQFLSTELAPERFQGSYVSIYNSAMSVQQGIGPALVTAMLVGWGLAGWSAIALILVAGSAGTMWLASRHVPGRLAQEAEETEPRQPDPPRVPRSPVKDSSA